MTRATAQLFQSLVWHTPHHVHDLDHTKTLLCAILNMAKAKKSFCFFPVREGTLQHQNNEQVLFCLSGDEETLRLSSAHQDTQCFCLLFIYHPCADEMGSVRCWSDCPLWRAVECHKNWRVPIILFLLRQQRWLQSASSPAILKKKTSKKFVPCIPPAVSFETHRRTIEQRAGRTRTKRLSLLTASQTSEDSVLVKDWLIDSDIFAVCQFPPVWNMNVGTSFPGSLMQCVRLSIKCVCAPVTSHAIAFVY